MNRLIALLASEFCGNLLTALSYSLWQGLVIAGLLLLFLKSKAAKDANVRYIAGLIALTVIVLCGLFTWAVLDYEPFPVSETLTSNSPSEMTTSFSDQIESNKESNLTREATLETDKYGEGFTESNWQVWAICVWLIGVVVMLLRAICLVVGGSRLRRQCRILEDEHVSDLVEQLRKSLGIVRQIRIAVSEHILVPGVVGCIRPVLLLPISMFSGVPVPVDDLRAILAHELAHIRRYDYLVNFYQLVVEAILFFNPTVWWISKQIRFEREACCDAAGIIATGQRIRYAEVLAGWTQRLRQTNVRIPATTIGFGRADESGSMLERVRRIIVVGHRPRLRVSWYIATITLILSLILLAGLWRGTTMTVALAGKLLTPKERIDKMKEIEKKHLDLEDREYTQADQITISGTVRTIDNKPLGYRSFVRIRRKTLKHSGTKDIQISRGPDGPFSSEGSFSVKVNYGLIWLYVKSEGYAPVFAGPLKTQPGGEIKNLDYVLDKGFSGKVKIINEDNEPIKGASLVGAYQHIPEVSYNDIKLTTNKDGFALVENAVDRSALFTITADGYEVEKFEDIKLSSDFPVVLALKRAKKTNGLVLSKVTGRPVPNAVIRMVMVRGMFGSHSYGPVDGPVLANTNEKGQFALNSLRSDSRYLMSVEESGYGHKLLYDITAGQEDLLIYLPEKLRVRGRITGSLEKLREKDGKYVINYSLGVIDGYDGGHWNAGKHAEVDVYEGQGYFEITEISGNRMSIGSGSYRKVLDIENESIQDVVIDLSDKVADTGQKYKNRELLLKFDYPKDAPALEGTLLFRYIDPDFALNTYKNQDVVIVDGQGKLNIPTPGKVGYDNKSISGYWFSEKREIKVPFAEEPFKITIPAIPAGSIYGEVFETDGSKANNVLVSVAVVEKSPLMEDSSFLGVEGKNSAGTSELNAKYVITPLPLGGKYRVVAHKESLYMVSEEIRLDEEMPIRQLDMKLPAGRPFKVKILDENGKPMSSAPIGFSYDMPSHGFSRDGGFTDTDGILVIKNINPDVPGDYQIVVKNIAGYRPVKRKIENFNDPLEIKLEKGHVVTGVVIDDETGRPIPGVEVYAIPEDFSIPEPTTYLDSDDVTDKLGRFRFSTMADREYQLGVRSGRLVKSQGHVVVTGGQQEDVILRINLSEHSNLKPLKPD